MRRVCRCDTSDLWFRGEPGTRASSAPSQRCPSVCPCSRPAAARAASGADGGAGDKLVVATTVAPITSIAAAVAGDRVDIEGIVPEGTNCHTFEPPPAGRRAASAPPTSSSSTASSSRSRPSSSPRQNKKDGAEIVELGTTVLPEAEYIYDFSFPEEDGKPNPHLWTDPTYAIKYAEVIEDTLVERDPANAAYYAANYDKFDDGSDRALAERPARPDQDRSPPASASCSPTTTPTPTSPRRTAGRSSARSSRRTSRTRRRRRSPADRPGQGRAGAGRSSAPRSSRPRCSSRSAGRPARATSTSCATTTCPAQPGDAGALVARADALRLRHDDRGARRRRPRSSRSPRPRVAPDKADYPQ